MLGPTDSVVPLAARQPSTRPSRQPFGVLLGPVAYALTRLGIHLLHGVCAAYFLVGGILYLALSGTYVVRLLSYYSLTVNPNWFRPISVVHFVFAAIHGCVLLWAIVTATFLYWFRRRFKRQTSSIKRRTASLMASIKGRAGTTTSTSKFAKISNMVSAVKPTRVGRAVLFVYKRLAAQQTFFDVASHDFELAFVLREATETILQAYQAYNMNRLLPRQQLNRFYVSMLVINCWTTPLVHHFSGGNEPLKRVLCLVCDIVLDFVSVIGVPVWLALDYLADYDPTTGTFKFLLFYNEAWMIRLLNDVPLILLGSWIDALTRLLFSWSMLTAIDDVKKLIKRKDAPNRVAVKLEHAPSKLAGPRLPSKWRGRFVVWTHRAMILFGFFILGTQLHAEFKPTPPSCVLQIRPWLTPLPACALVEINCYTHPELLGDQTDFEATFGHIDTVSLEQIVIRHCPRVEITSRLQTLHGLIGFKTYNSTIVTWNEDAGFSQTHHQHLRFVYFVRARFPNAAMPRGLVESTFSPNFKEISISGTNLVSLPDNLHEHWPPALAFHVEYGELTEFPPSLLLLTLGELSLSYNKITRLPQEVFQLPCIVAVTGNPITSLPDAIDMTLVVTPYLFIDRSLVAYPLPLWIDEALVTSTRLFLGDSPFCVDVALNTNSSEYAELAATRPWLVDGRVDCSVFDLYFYPTNVDARASEGLGGV